MKKNEAGRSMVEMLGTLAVIGVLSVAGITGFSMAMNKHKANQIIATGSTLYMLAVANMATNPTGSAYGDIGSESPYGGVTMTVKTEDGEVIVTVEDASPEVCKIVNNSFGDDQEFTIDCPTSE